MSEDILHTLANRLELKDLVCRYARAADRHDYPELRKVFTKDARTSGYRGEPGSVEPIFAFEGLDEVIGSLELLEVYDRVNHVVSNQLVEIAGDAATGETYGTTHFVWYEEGALTHRTHVCCYQDKYRRESGGAWQIEERQLVFDWEYDRTIGERGFVAERES